jgi:hypothetical protein
VRLALLALSALLAVAALVSAQAALGQTNEAVQASEVARFGYGALRPGANGNDPTAPNASNADEATVGDLPVPPLLPGGARWQERRAEIARLVEREWVGEIPAEAGKLGIVWSKQRENRGEHWLGQLSAADGRMGPVIDGTLSLPPGKGPFPVMIEYSYIWPPGFRWPGPPMPSLRDAALRHGWAHFAYRPALLQPDALGKLCEGVIGLVRCPRAEHDWGALRAWGWGASRLRERLAADPRIDGARISLAGHSRFGKAVLAAAAFDHGFADALVSSSGAGGAKLMRRDFGERIENMADPYASIWHAPRIRHYAGRASVADWPVDAHMLIALRAPRPLFIATGLTEKGDGWTDPNGQWLATVLARPAWSAYDGAVFADQPRPVPHSGPTDTPLAFWQHGEGHVMWPAFAPFFAHADRFGR